MLLLFLTGLLLTACGGQTVYHAYQSLPSSGWAKTDTLSFPVEISDSTAKYAFCLELRHRGEYPYRTLSLALSCHGEESVFTDTLTFELADERGRWTGNGLGALYQNVLPARHLPIKHAGLHTVSLQYVADDILLPGIHDVGIKVFIER